jgi:hypothetical protein
MMAAMWACAAAAAAAVACTGEYSLCPTGECTLDGSLCGLCGGAGQYLCPDCVTCVASAELLVTQCPSPPLPLYNWRLSTAQRVADTLPLLNVTEKALLLQVRAIRGGGTAR